jgi:hypothetical protein
MAGRTHVLQMLVHTTAIACFNSEFVFVTYSREHAVFTASGHAITAPQRKRARCSHPQGLDLIHFNGCPCWALAVPVHAHMMLTAHVFKMHLATLEHALAYGMHMCGLAAPLLATSRSLAHITAYAQALPCKKRHGAGC